MGTKDFTDKQLTAIDMLAQGILQKDIQEKLDISHSTIWAWKKDPQFMDAICEQARIKIKDALPTVYETLANKAKEGDYHHIKILLDHLEKLSEERSKYAGRSITFTWENDSPTLIETEE